MKIVKAMMENPRGVAIVVMLGVLAVFGLFVPKYIIGSGSMEPTLPVGTIVVVGEAADLKPTDIITYQQEGDSAPTTHTFIGYAEDGSLMSKGDANPTPDVHNPPLLMEDVKGKVISAILPIRLIGFALVVVLALWLIPGRQNDKKQSSEDAKESVTNPA